ncbi:MAG: AAA family ATPase [Eubacterium sp.]|uniref:AAA family ATPase n=1 Tax=Eubacterium sp. TaxID=142586 RepID=UPI00300F2FC6
MEKKAVQKKVVKAEKLKKYIFIIDEINRGEISKILGELFFAIDPGYRGKSGEVSTQYANMHSNPIEKFYIPENVYIIGTMNDIDRSVDRFS